MRRTIKSKECVVLLFGVLLFSVCRTAFAQRPQDNWYLEQTWTRTGTNWTATNGGLSAPCSVAIGPDGRVYVGDEGYSCIQVYLPDGTYTFSITNAFGGGQSFIQPRGMITDQAGQLYVADYGRNCVFVFDGNGLFIRRIGGVAGSGDGELSGVIDVGVGSDASVYILENGNARVSVFSHDGVFLRKWGGHGTLDGQLINPVSLAITADDWLYICQNEWQWNGQHSLSKKEFDKYGVWLRTTSTHSGYSHYSGWGGFSVRIDPGGYAHVIRSPFLYYGNLEEFLPPYHEICARDGQVDLLPLSGPQVSTYNGDLKSPCHAVGPDGTIVLCQNSRQMLWRFRMAFRDQSAVPRNAIPVPAVANVRQRSNSPLVDVGYRVTDADDVSVHAAMLAFKSDTQSLSNCIANPTLVEGTATNLGPSIAANTDHRLTWNVGADWSVNLGQFRVVILARDSRSGLLDIHYLRLPAGGGKPALKMSRSPLIQNDFMQVWWWLLATNDVAITLSSNRIYGASGAYNNKVLCEDEKTTADGRAYLCEKMRVREATAEEVQWARQATMPVGTDPNQWPPGRSIGGRPAVVNEYGFDTGDWGEDAYWVVPLD